MHLTDSTAHYRDHRRFNVDGLDKIKFAGIKLLVLFYYDNELILNFMGKQRFETVSVKSSSEYA